MFVPTASTQQKMMRDNLKILLPSPSEHDSAVEMKDVVVDFSNGIAYLQCHEEGVLEEGANFLFLLSFLSQLLKPEGEGSPIASCNLSASSNATWKAQACV